MQLVYNSFCLSVSPFFGIRKVQALVNHSGRSYGLSIALLNAIASAS